VAANAADSYGFQDEQSCRRGIFCYEHVTTITGGAGAVGSQDTDDPNLTVAKNAGTGLYDITFPKGQKARVYAIVLSPAGTVKTWYLTALSATAGTAQIQLGNGGGTATNPAASDQIFLYIRVESRLT
jgi:hypothetical protein